MHVLLICILGFYFIDCLILLARVILYIESPDNLLINEYIRTGLNNLRRLNHDEGGAKAGG